MSTLQDANSSRDEILAVCTALEEGASAMYGRFAKSARNPKLAALFTRMEGEELQHAATLRRLDKWPMHDLPVALDDVARARAQAEALFHESTHPNLSDERMVTIAAALELSEMDDVFGAICRGAGLDPERGRANHIGGLVEMASTLDGDGGALRSLLAAFVRLDRRTRAYAPEGDPRPAGH